MRNSSLFIRCKRRNLPSTSTVIAANDSDVGIQGFLRASSILSVLHSWARSIPMMPTTKTSMMTWYRYNYV